MALATKCNMLTTPAAGSSFVLGLGLMGHIILIAYAVGVSKILFVCTANLCRSPMAEFLWNKLDGVPSATSAGLWARPGAAMHPFTAAELSRRGVSAEEIAAFRSHGLAPEVVKQSELILCMEATHREKILASFPAALNKTFTVLKLAELSVRFPGVLRDEARQLKSRTTAGDVADPVNLPEAEFTRTGDVLATALPAIAKWVVLDRNR